MEWVVHIVKFCDTPTALTLQLKTELKIPLKQISLRCHSGSFCEVTMERGLTITEFKRHFR